MVSDTININFLYLTISVIILITVYNFLNNSEEPSDTEKAYIEIHNKVYEVSPDKCDVYLNNIHNNLKLLHRAADKTACNKLRVYIDQARADLQNFTHRHGMSPNDLDLLRYDIINKHGLLKDSLSDDRQDTETDKAFADILIDLEIIVYMVRHSLCQDRPLVLTNLYTLMEQLYSVRCHNGRTYSEGVSAFTDYVPELYDTTALDIMESEFANVCARGPSTNSECSQNIEKNVLDDEDYSVEKETPLYIAKNPENKSPQVKVDKRLLVSQEFDCSADYILSQKGSQPYVPFCDIAKLRAERAKLRAKTTDLAFNRSLRSDYDYLDA